MFERIRYFQMEAPYSKTYSVWIEEAKEDLGQGRYPDLAAEKSAV